MLVSIRFICVSVLISVVFSVISIMVITLECSISTFYFPLEERSCIMYKITTITLV